MDGYPNLEVNNGLGYVWEDAIRDSSVRELMRCMFRNHRTYIPGIRKQEYRQGFVVGRLTHA